MAASKGIQAYLYKSEQWQPVETHVIVEKPVSLTVNGEVWLTLMCTPVDLEALAVGFLFNENVIKSKADIASVRVCENEENVDVWLNFSVELPISWRRTSGCTGGITSTDPEQVSAAVQAGMRLAPQTISHLVHKLFESQELYKEAGGVHTSALSDGETVLLTADDIGRHNTLDKLAGRCLLDELKDTPRILITTGRVSSEMMQKANRIGAEVVISRTAPSSLTVELARRWGITLIGYARRDRFTVYSFPERIASPHENVIISTSTRRTSTLLEPAQKESQPLDV